MQIGGVAQRTGLSVRTIRFQDSWLVVLSARGQGGFRLYTDDDGARLQPPSAQVAEVQPRGNAGGARTAGRSDRPGARHGRSVGVLVERLTVYRELARQRAPVLHER
jgi:MerR HTH family regulatory protein